jgi:hypothetical protein
MPRNCLPLHNALELATVPVPLFSQLNPVHSSTFYFFTVNFNIIQHVYN